MQVIIHQWAFNGSFDQLASLPRQELVNDWFGYDVEPSAEFAFATDGEFLWFLASRILGDKDILHETIQAGGGSRLYWVDEVPFVTTYKSYRSFRY